MHATRCRDSTRFERRCCSQGDSLVPPSEPCRRARYFYVPTWDLHGAWGNPEVYLRAHRYIRTHFPYWNASQGKDHIWTVTRDAAACSTPCVASHSTPDHVDQP